MASVSLPQQCVLARNPRVIAPRFASTLVALVTLGCVFVAALHPVGYVGSGLDDMRYLAGVDCLINHGFCVPANHWEARIPFVYPAALIAAFVGESREALWILPILFSIAAISLLGLCVAEVFGRRAGLFASMIFLLCAEIANRLLDFGIDLPEFAFLAGGVFCLLRGKGATAGVFFGFAILCRPTTLALAPFVTVYLVRAQRWDLLWRSALSFAGVLLIESVAMALMAGDPFLTWRLAFRHNTIPSSALNFVPFSGNPLFNMRLVASWPASASIEAPWAIRAPINFLGNPSLIILHAVTFAALVLTRAARLFGLALSAVGYFLIVAYVFAIDPAPRMFLPTIAVECAIVAAYVVQSSGSARMLGMICAIGLATICVITSFDRTDLRIEAKAVESLLRRDPTLQVETGISSLLEIRSLHHKIYSGGRGRLIAIVRSTCRTGRKTLQLPPTATITNEQSIDREEPAFASVLRSRRWLLRPLQSEQVCIYDVDA